MYPKSLDRLIESFLRLPGVGKKTAERYAYYIVNNFSKDDIEKLMENLSGVKDKIKRCRVCGFLTEDDLCEYCSDSERDQTTILVVEEPKDVESIERCRKYHGLYHVLNGSISPLNGIGPEELNLQTLFKRIKESKIKEVIIATSATVGGEATALYINKILENEEVTVSRIAYGMPVGSSLEYNDETTIMKALEGRKNMR
ncbi:MAG: recombination protein RecR [Bacillales bacterium]|nr:recombination protein RecR [Bacillales bacterium]